MTMGIAESSQFSPLAMRMVKAALAAGPEGARKVIQKYQLSADPQEKLAAFIAGPMVERELTAVQRQQALQGYRPQPTVLDQMASTPEAPQVAPRGVAGLPTDEEYGSTMHAAGGGIIAFNDGGNPADAWANAEEEELRRQRPNAPETRQERHRPFTEEEARQRARAASDARRAAQTGTPRPVTRVSGSLSVPSIAERAALGLEGLGKKVGAVGAGLALGKVLEPAAEATGLPEVLSRGAEKLFPFNVGTGWSVPDNPKKQEQRYPPSIPQVVDRSTPSTAYEKIAAMNERQTKSLLPDQMPYVSVVQGADLLAALPSVQRNAILKNARETGLKEFSINYPGADGKPVKGTVVLGEPPQAQEEGKASSSPSRLRADTDVAQKVANAQDALDRLRQEAQQVGPPKGMGQYVGDVKGALEAAGVRGEVGTEAEARIRENLGRIDDDKRFALGMSIAQAGFAAAAAKSPYALANIAEGFGIGVKQYTSAMADIKKAQREEQKALTEIEAARRGEKLKIGTTAYEQRQKDIADAQKRYDDAQRAVATGSIQLANIVLDASTANVRTDVMRDQNLITQLNNLGIKEDAQRIAILKEAGERAHKMLAAVISPTPQKEEEIRRKAFESVIAESKALNIGVASGAQVPTASAAPARKPGFEVVGVR